MKMSLKGIRLVTFDATNTLLRFKIHPWQYYANIGRNYGFEGSINDLKPRLLQSYNMMWNKHPNFGKTTISWESWWTQVVQKTFDGHLPKKADINSLAVDLINDFKTTKCWYLADGANEILSILKNRGITIGVISNFDPRLTEILHNVNIYDKIDFIVTSFEIGYTKPDREIFDHALKILVNISPKECLHIGDDLQNDYKAARDAGWNALLVTNKISNFDYHVDKEYCFNNLKEIHDVILENRI